MEIVKSEARRVVDDVLAHLEVLEGTDYADCVNKVRIELTNRLEDIVCMIQSNNELEINPKSTINTMWIERKKYRICHVAVQLAGEGKNAFGAVGVVWAEEIQYNVSMQVMTNTVNKRTSELWAMAIAAKTAKTRDFKHIMIMTDNYTYTKRLLKDLEEGKLDNTECKVLVEKIREYMNEGLEIRIPDEVEDACIRSGSTAVVKKAKKLAREAFQEAKKSHNK